MKALGCRGVRRRLAVFHDGELPIAERTVLQTHFNVCRRCMLELNRLAAIGNAIRAGARARQPIAGDLVALRASVVGRIEAERETSWKSRLRELFDDMHLIWAGVGGAAFAATCVAVLTGLFYFGTTAERPDSIAGLIEALASPGSNANPISVDGRMRLPRAYAEDAEGVIMPATLVTPGDESVFALAAVVTREGRITNLELLLAQERRGRGGRAGDVLNLLDAISKARFEPAHFAGSPIAVNMVWLLAHTTVRGKLHG